MADVRARCCPLLGLLLVLLCSGRALAQAGIRELRVESPRAYGYTIGDHILRRVTLSLRDPYRLQRGDLPAAGRLDHWLIREPAVIDERPEDDGITYRIDLGYRIIKLDPDVEQLSIPSLRLMFGDGQSTLGATVPEWRFRVAWLSDPARPADTLQPDRAPLPLRPPLLELGAAGTGLLLALGLLGYRYGRLPFVARGPFDQALRDLRRLPSPWDADRQRAALRAVHAAFDRIADGTVAGERLDQLFLCQPKLAALRPAIEEFFARSAAVFFQPAPTLPPPDRDQLLRLCRRCRDALRGVA